MSTSIKYSEIPVDNVIKSNNFIMGNNTIDYGPTEVTGFYIGVDPPASGYTIYLAGGPTGINARCAHSDNEAILIAREYGGININTVIDAITYFITGSTGTTIINMDFPCIVTNGLVLYYDFRLIPSYPRAGVIVRDLTENNNGNLTGSPIVNDGGILLNGSSQYIDFATHYFGGWTQTEWTMCAWFKTTNTVSTSYRNPIFGELEDSSLSAISIDSGMTNMVYYDYVEPPFGVWRSVYIQDNVADGQWHSLITTLQVNYPNPGSWAVYIDGVYVNTLSCPGLHYIWLDAIGANRFGGFFDGNISNAQLYDRILSSSEIIQNYYATAMPEGIVTNGLSLALDAGNMFSYIGSGSTWNDLSINNNNCTLSSITYDPGKFLTYIVGTYTNFYAPSLSGTTTVEMLCKIKSTTGNMIFGWYAYDVYVTGSFGYNTGNSDLYGLTSSQVTSLGLENNWKHYIFEMRSNASYTNNKIYVNSVNQSLSQIIGSESSLNRNFNNGNGRISGWRAGSGFTMPMDLSLFRVYNRSLSQSEINQNYNAIKSRFGL